jgi:hypothetical protein
MSLSNSGPPNARWVPLCKVMQYACVPRVGDLVCYCEQTHGCGYPVISVTHLDGGKVVCEVEPEKWDDDIDELMEVVEFWCNEGWQRKLPHEINDCHKCGSLSGVYLQICDDCMTQFNKLSA